MGFEPSLWNDPDLLLTSKANKQLSRGDQGEAKLLLLAPCSPLWCEITTWPWLIDCIYTDTFTSLFFALCSMQTCSFLSLFTDELWREWQYSNENRLSLSDWLQRQPIGVLLLLELGSCKPTVAVLLLHFIKSTTASILFFFSFFFIHNLYWIKERPDRMDRKPCVL